MARVPTSAVLAAAVALSTIALAQPPPVRTIALPADASFPEGIAYSPSEQAFYTANAETGAIVRVNRKDGTARVVTPAGVIMPAGTTTFPIALGMKIDGAGRLWVAGGRSARISVVDITSGRLVRQVITPDPAASLINDVALADGAAYFTDTRVPTLWRMSAAGAIGALEPWLSFVNTKLQYDAGLNLNGIAATPDGRFLIVVQMDKGLLFRIEIATKRVTPIETSGAALGGGDGLVLAGSTLYLVRQPAGEIVTLQMSPDFGQAAVVARFRDPALLWPATAVLVDQELVVVNSQFNARATKSARMPFTLAAVPLARLMPVRPPQ